MFSFSQVQRQRTFQSAGAIGTVSYKRWHDSHHMLKGAMALPVDDPKLAKLQILHGRATIANRAARDLEQEARRKEAATRQQLYDFIRELGFCPHCELPMIECSGHDEVIGRPHDRRHRPRDDAKRQSG